MQLFSPDGNPSVVSSFVIKAWQKNGNGQMSTIDAADNGTPAIKTYEEYTTWKELKQYISKEGPQPPFSIE
jgi:hypothetical protein